MPQPRRPRRLTLAGHAARLLAGTGLTAADAALAASGDPAAVIPPAAQHAARELRDGWDAAAPAPHPAPAPEPDDEAGSPQ